MVTIADWIMVAFTGILAGATIVYVIVSIILFARTGKSAKQSRAAFLADMIIRALDLERQFIHPDSTLGKYWDEPEKVHGDIAEIFGDIDAELKRDFMRAMNNFQRRRTEKVSEMTKAQGEKKRA